MKNKTTEYILGMITGISIMIAIWSMTDPLQANYNAIGTTKYNPLYVKIVD